MVPAQSALHMHATNAFRSPTCMVNMIAKTCMQYMRIKTKVGKCAPAVMEERSEGEDSVVLRICNARDSLLCATDIPCECELACKLAGATDAACE